MGDAGKTSMDTLVSIIGVVIILVILTVFMVLMFRLLAVALGHPDGKFEWCDPIGIAAIIMIGIITVLAIWCMDRCLRCQFNACELGGLGCQ